MHPESESLSDKYTIEYFASFRDSSRASAEVVVPIVKSWINPRSVADFGCGLGMWLSVWSEAGCDVQGIDGDWVDRNHLAIPREKFIAHDLSQPIELGRRFDLAMSVEAAEHLPPEAASVFVQSLTSAAPVVLFSASIPHQPGEGHVNCQWPSYWAELFAERGYRVFDRLRYTLWEDERVDWWYRQNIMLYVEAKHAERLAALSDASDRERKPLPLVHPVLMQTWHDWGIDQSKRYWDLWSKVNQQSDT
jgi:hypothetical protein